MKIAAITFLVIGIVSAGLCTHYHIQADNFDKEAASRIILAFHTVELIRNNSNANKKAELEQALDQDIREYWALRPPLRQHKFYSLLSGLGGLVSFAISVVLLLVLVFFPKRKTGV